MKYSHNSAKAAGCENPATAEQTAVKGGGFHLGVKTWTPAEAKNGYSNRAMGSVSPAKVGLNTGGSGGGKQSVKGKMGKNAPSESKGAAGQI